MQTIPIESVRGTAGPIKTVLKLRSALGISTAQLVKVLKTSDENRYKLARGAATKADGSVREVYNPSMELRLVQSRIVSRLMKPVGVIRWPNFLYGAMPNQIGPNQADIKKDYIACATNHCGAKSLLKVDVKNFFGNVHADIVKNIWKQVFGYPDSVAYVLTNLCTKGDSLPQGGLTSSYLAMLALHDVEAKVVAALVRKGLVYTRYIDDITVSAKVCDYDFTYPMQIIQDMLFSKALPINEHKVKRSTISTEALTVHGLRICFDTPRLPADEVGRIRAAVKTIELLAAEGRFRESISYRRSYNRCMGRVNKLKRVGHSQHESLVRRLKVIRPLPSRLDIKKAIISTKRLQSEYSVRGGSFGYRMRYYVTIDRINLIGVLYYDLAKTLRGRLHAIRPTS